MRGGKLSLPGFDCGMKAGFDFRCCASVCHRVAGQLLLHIIARCNYACGFACHIRVLATNFGASLLMVFLNLPSFPSCPWSDSPCSGPSALHPNILPFNNMVKTNTWSHYMQLFLFIEKPCSCTAAVNLNASLHKIFHL